MTTTTATTYQGMLVNNLSYFFVLIIPVMSHDDRIIVIQDEQVAVAVAVHQEQLVMSLAEQLDLENLIF